MAHNNFDRKNLRRYHFELGGSIVLYLVLLLGAITSFRYFGPVSAGRALASLAPMIGFGLMLWAIYRAIRRMDELQRQLTLEILAWASAVTVFLTFTYGFLELGLKFPRLSMFAVWMVFGTAWFGTGVIYGMMGRGNPFWPKSTEGP